MNDIVASPDVLLNDPDSMEFYVLRNEQVVVCKRRQDLPYYKNRQTYLSSGRFSPKHKRVIFWPEPINPQRAMQLLKEQLHIDESYTYSVGGSVTKINKSNKDSGPLNKLNDRRKMRAESLIRDGMKIQGADNSKEENQPEAGN